MCTSNSSTPRNAFVSSFLLFALMIVGCSSQPFVSEFMIQPIDGITLEKGTWIELYNPTSIDYDLSGAKVELTNEKDISSSYILPSKTILRARSYFVAGSNKDRATNGNAPVDFEYSPYFEMSPNKGTIRVYIKTAFGWFNAFSFTYKADFPFVPGASINFFGKEKSSASSWCVSSSTSYGPTLNKGTPGAPNKCVVATSSTKPPVAPVPAPPSNANTVATPPPVAVVVTPPPIMKPEGPTPTPAAVAVGDTLSPGVLVTRVPTSPVTGGGLRSLTPTSNVISDGPSKKQPTGVPLMRPVSKAPVTPLVASTPGRGPLRTSLRKAWKSLRSLFTLH